LILDRNDVRLSYFVAGEGAPVTLLHGFTQSGRSWREVISFMPQGYMWVVPDLRGHGDTSTRPGAPCSMDACTADLELLWDHLGIAQTHIAGYSMGGRLAIHVAARRTQRVSSLLTIGAHAGLDEQTRVGRRQGDEALAQRIENDGIEAFVNYWSGLPLFAGLQRRGPGFIAQVRTERLANRGSGLACSLRGMGAGAMEPVWDELADLSFPCTFVAGQLDHGYVASARRLAAAVQHGRVEIVPRAGHPVHQERPDTFARILANHLDPTPAAAPTSRAEEIPETFDDASASSSTWA
jgi:2-succinyl-6-hydroxy-2,4-cyclohexadiene-1-carboxylate synthase